MKRAKSILLFFLAVTGLIQLCGCWNYQDIEKLAIVSGFTIDRQDDNYLITVETVDFEISGKDAKQASKFIEAKGKTIFDAVRNIIDFSGKKLYWAHANVVIISEELAKVGISPLLDLIFRDAEVREEMYIFISKEKTAGEVLKQETPLSQTSSENIENIITGQSRVGNSYPVQVYELINSLEEEGISVTLPCLCLQENSGKQTARPDGVAIFRGDKLAGFLSPEETRYFLFAINKFRKGILTLKEHSSREEDNISLEVYKSKTDFKPKIIENKLTMNINIKQEAALAELGTSKDYIKEKNRPLLEKDAEKKLKKALDFLIKRVQTDFDTDIFGFGRIVKANMPGVWKSAQKKKTDLFRDLNIDINVDIGIKNSALGSKVIKKGD